MEHCAPFPKLLKLGTIVPSFVFCIFHFVKFQNSLSRYGVFPMSALRGFPEVSERLILGAVLSRSANACFWAIVLKNSAFSLVFYAS